MLLFIYLFICGVLVGKCAQFSNKKEKGSEQAWILKAWELKNNLFGPKQLTPGFGKSRGGLEGGVGGWIGFDLLIAVSESLPRQWRTISSLNSIHTTVN